MPNWCYTSCIIVGDKKELQDLNSKLDYLENLPKSLVENGFGKRWLGNIITLFGEDWNNIKCRGEWTDKYLDDDRLTLFIESAWSPPLDLLRLIESKYEDLKIYFISDEPGMNIHVTNDSKFEYFTDTYYLGMEDDQYYYNKEELNELLELLNSCYNLSLKTFEEALDFVEQHNSENTSDYIELFKYEYYPL